MTQKNIMRYLSITLLMIISSMHIFGQNPKGCYRNQSDSLLFENGEVIFSVSDFGALSTRMVGKGSCERIEDYLLINTKAYDGEKTTFNMFEGNNNDTLRVQVTSKQNYPINGAMVEFNSKSGKALKRMITDEEGRVYFLKNPKLTKNISNIQVSHLGHNAITLDFDNNSEYLVKLAKNHVLENQTVVFKIENEDVESISIQLLSDNFESKKDKLKELQSLDKKAQKRNRLGKIYKKEYEPEFSGR